MIYWLFFSGGVGGDGIANLLEFAEGMESVTGVREWRYADAKNGKIKFNLPTWVEPKQWFRFPAKMPNLEDATLTEEFKKAMQRDANLVLTSHYFAYESTIDKFKHKHLFKEQKKIWLYSTDIDRVIQDIRDKITIIDVTDQFINEYIPILKKWNDLIIDETAEKHNLFDVHIDIERVWDDWQYFDDKLRQVGIILQRHYYEEYLDIAKKRRCVTPT